MKRLSKFTVVNILCLASYSLCADNIIGSSDDSKKNAEQTEMVTYLKYISSYLGFGLDEKKEAITTPPMAFASQQLIDSANTGLIELMLWNASLKSIPVPFKAASYVFKLAPDTPLGKTINSYANATFEQQNYNSPSSPSYTVSVNTLIDQPSCSSIPSAKEDGSVPPCKGDTYQSDPVSQSLINLIGTPDQSFCKEKYCPNPLTKTKVMNYVVGDINTLPSATQVFNPGYIQSFLAQINSDSLLAPLNFDTSNTKDGGNTPEQSLNSPTLSAQNQAQAAANFIRYVSGNINPPELPSWNDYTNTYNSATTLNNAHPETQLKDAKTLTNYLVNLRVYAAQSSVGLSNLYFILSKRLPQKTDEDSTPSPSQALSEFNMATWRINDPNAKAQWMDSINKASPATVQKEIAVLLAEINYQLYLDRQVQERILLTNSVMLLQNTKQAQPSSDLQGSQGN